jgi:hypothetical protein
MARITDNDELLGVRFRPEAAEEPQVLFRSDVWIEFDESYRYGRRSKVELLLRLGVPGPWERWWAPDPWEPALPALGGHSGWRHASWVARLASCVDPLENNIQLRGRGRLAAVRAHLHGLDVHLLEQRYDPDRLLAVDEAGLLRRRELAASGDAESVAMLDELRAAADQARTLDIPSVMTKTARAPSGDPHDYFHPAPYWWPNPDTRSGLPYVKRDGVRVPGTGGEGGPGSEQFDRWSLQRMIDETFTLALAWAMHGTPEHRSAATDRLRAWFIDPATRMNPHLTYAQVRLGHDGDEGQCSGIIEFSDVYYLLEAVRLLDRGEGTRALSLEDHTVLREWFAAYLGWLTDSKQGQHERAAGNNHGTWYDVQYIAIAAWLGEHDAVQQTVIRASERVHQQFAADGAQPEELRRAIPLHYVTYNLAGWSVLDGLIRRITGAHDPIGARATLERAQEWILAHHERLAAGELDFDAVRLRVLEPGLELPNQPPSVHWGIRPWTKLPAVRRP